MVFVDLLLLELNCGSQKFDDVDNGLAEERLGGLVPIHRGFVPTTCVAAAVVAALAVIDVASFYLVLNLSWQITSVSLTAHHIELFQVVLDFDHKPLQFDFLEVWQNALWLRSPVES